MSAPEGPADAVPVTWRQVHAFRMARHHLARPAPRSRVAEVVADACGVQAQMIGPAQLALRVRVRGLTLDDVDRALWKERSVARVWCMRGTVHLVPSDEFAVFVRGSSSRQESRVAAWLERAHVPKASAERLLAAMAAAMDIPRTRPEIAARIRGDLGLPIVRGGGRGWGSPADAEGFRVGETVFTVAGLAFLASYRGLICYGPDEGRAGTFVRPDVWLPAWKDLPLAEAEEALLRRYLRACAPATPHDFSIWSGLAVTRARDIWSRLGHEIAPVTVDGRTSWALERDRTTLERARLPASTVRLLPYFDSFLMGHRERSHLVDKAHHKRVFRPAGWVYPAVLADGHVAGDWSYTRSTRGLRVRVRSYEALDGTTRDAIRGEAEDVARFLGVSEAHTTFAKAR